MNEILHRLMAIWCAASGTVPNHPMNISAAVFSTASASPSISHASLITSGGGLNYTLYSVGSVTLTVRDSTVTASGEIRPRKYVNIGANVMGRLTDILVKEGDRVRKGQLLARQESVQAGADVEAQKASLSSSQADAAGAGSVPPVEGLGRLS